MNKQSNPLNKFDGILNGLTLKEHESKIIGTMLVEFFETEQALDLCLATWFMPLVNDRFDSFINRILLFAPLGRKLDCAMAERIIDIETIKKFRKVAELRNNLAHRRPDDKRIGKIITESKKEQYIKDCQSIRFGITSKTREHMEKIKKYYGGILSDYGCKLLVGLAEQNLTPRKRV